MHVIDQDVAPSTSTTPSAMSQRRLVYTGLLRPNHGSLYRCYRRKPLFALTSRATLYDLKTSRSYPPFLHQKQPEPLSCLAITSSRMQQVDHSYIIHIPITVNTPSEQVYHQESPSVEPLTSNPNVSIQLRPASDHTQPVQHHATNHTGASEPDSHRKHYAS